MRRLCLFQVGDVARAKDEKGGRAAAAGCFSLAQVGDEVAGEGEKVPVTDCSAFFPACCQQGARVGFFFHDIYRACHKLLTLRRLLAFFQVGDAVAGNNEQVSVGGLPRRLLALCFRKVSGAAAAAKSKSLRARRSV